jgi:hypothetical protein
MNAGMLDATGSMAIGRRDDNAGAADNQVNRCRRGAGRLEHFLFRRKRHCRA